METAGETQGETQRKEKSRGVSRQKRRELQTRALRFQEKQASLPLTEADCRRGWAWRRGPARQVSQVKEWFLKSKRELQVAVQWLGFRFQRRGRGFHP